MTNKIKLYDDDGKIISKEVDTKASKKCKLTWTNDWVLDWSMQLNESKCVVVHMGGKLNSNKAYTIRKRDGTRVELQS